MSESVQRDSAYGSDDRPTLVGLLRVFGRSLKLGIHTCLPGKVVLVRDDTPGEPLTVDVQPGFQGVYLDGDGKEKALDLPVVRRAVVGHFAGGGFVSGVKPLLNDHGWLIFCERHLERWMGKGNTPVDPVWSEILGMNGAMFLPVGHPGPAAPQLTADLSIRDPTGTNEIKIELGGTITVKGAVKVKVEAPTAEVTATVTATVDAPSIKLGATATEQLVKGTLFMNTIFNVHTHGTPVGPSGPPVPLMTAAQLTTKSKGE